MAWRRRASSPRASSPMASSRRASSPRASSRRERRASSCRRAPRWAAIGGSEGVSERPSKIHFRIFSAISPGRRRAARGDADGGRRAGARRTSETIAGGIRASEPHRAVSSRGRHLRIVLVYRIARPARGSDGTSDHRPQRTHLGGRGRARGGLRREQLSGRRHGGAESHGHGGHSSLAMRCEPRRSPGRAPGAAPRGQSAKGNERTFVPDWQRDIRS